MASPSRLSLKAFLTAARAALATPASRRPQPLTIVIGNESADLDSLCSATLLAYLCSYTSSSRTLHVPLCHLERADLHLRPELKAALAGSGHGLKPLSSSAPPPLLLDDLLTLSELPDDLTAADSRWILVDHNALTGSLARRFSSSVIGCIDHHMDEGAVPHPKPEDGTAGNAPPRIIEPCGSAMSLIVRTYADAWRALAAEQPLDGGATDRLLARMALAPILVDTSNLTSASKTTDTDRHAVTVAESFLEVIGAGSAVATAAQDEKHDRRVFFEELSRLKDDISSFDYGDILRKDYKQWMEKSKDGSELALGMSTVVQGFEYLLANIGGQEDLWKSLYEFARARRLDLVAVMAVRHDAKVRFGRQLLLCAFSQPAQAAAKAFVEANTKALGLTAWEGDELTETEALPWRKAWIQEHTEFSRKQVAPLLREAMRSVHD